ncbi:hypothetical protein [Priestia abyssalis]|uniref:hypothetical protein n=1 Tax=Priestia abyssalis TaxID=1221450 RepID=UPI000995B725|nr:hypothetical protein [Priestia abyssalis]
MNFSKVLTVLLLALYLTSCSNHKFVESSVDPSFPVPEKAELIMKEPSEEAKHIEKFAKYKQKNVQNGTHLYENFEEEIKAKGWKEIKTVESPKIRGFQKGDKIIYLTANRDNFQLIKLKDNTQWLE